MDRNNLHEEWYFQSDYDLETAVDMFNSGRMIYSIFMCHLSLEKALKGLLIKRTGKLPVKSHSLIYFLDKLELQLTKNDYDFISTLNNISVPTRYPEDLKKLINTFTEDRTKSILEQTKKIRIWIIKQ